VGYRSDPIFLPRLRRTRQAREHALHFEISASRFIDTMNLLIGFDDLRDLFQLFRSVSLSLLRCVRMLLGTVSFFLPKRRQPSNEHFELGNALPKGHLVVACRGRIATQVG